MTFNIKEWRQAMDYTQERAANLLGITLRTYQSYEKHPENINKTTELACTYLFCHQHLTMDYDAAEVCRMISVVNQSESNLLGNIKAGETIKREGATFTGLSTPAGVYDFLQKTQSKALCDYWALNAQSLGPTAGCYLLRCLTLAIRQSPDILKDLNWMCYWGDWNEAPATLGTKQFTGIANQLPDRNKLLNVAFDNLETTILDWARGIPGKITHAFMPIRLSTQLPPMLTHRNADIQIIGDDSIIAHRKPEAIFLLNLYSYDAAIDFRYLVPPVQVCKDGKIETAHIGGLRLRIPHYHGMITGR